MKSEKNIKYSCTRIKISAGDEKCIEVMVKTDNLVMPYYDREVLLEKCFVSCAISTCVINYAILVRSAP